MPADTVGAALGLLGLGLLIMPHMPANYQGVGCWLLVSLIAVPAFLILSPMLLPLLFILGVMTHKGGG